MRHEVEEISTSGRMPEGKKIDVAFSNICAWSRASFATTEATRRIDIPGTTRTTHATRRDHTAREQRVAILIKEKNTSAKPTSGNAPRVVPTRRVSRAPQCVTATALQRYGAVTIPRS